MGRLTSHVLDTANGVPAAGLRLELFDGAGRQLASVATNAGGRTDQPLLDGPEFKAGRYQLRFHVGAYFRARGVAVGEPAFLDIVSVDFGIDDPGVHFHVPLLVSPWSYTTYRGS